MLLYAEWRITCKISISLGNLRTLVSLVILIGMIGFNSALAAVISRCTVYEFSALDYQMRITHLEFIIPRAIS